MQKRNGFTLIELLVVIAVIGLLGTLTTVALASSREKARDSIRLADMRQIITALDLYFDDNGNYPIGDGDGCGGWDTGNQDYSFLDNKLTGYINDVPEDPSATGTCSGYRYYRYSAGSYGCDVTYGDFYIIGITDLETYNTVHPASPSLSCPGRDWETEFEWTTGRFQYQ